MFSPERFRAHVEFLADDLLEGRETGTRGYDIAARYVATQFEAYGLKPGGVNDSWYQPVTFQVTTRGNEPTWVTIEGPAGEQRFNHKDNVLVALSSQDVIHSFFVPQFRMKQDAVPGRQIRQWFEATKPGKYELPCAELCGFGHSGMRAWIYVHTPEAYEKWAAENLTVAAAPAPAGAERAAAVVAGTTGGHTKP